MKQIWQTDTIATSGRVILNELLDSSVDVHVITYEINCVNY